MNAFQDTAPGFIEPIESVESEHPWIWLVVALFFIGGVAGSAVFA